MCACKPNSNLQAYYPAIGLWEVSWFLWKKTKLELKGNVNPDPGQEAWCIHLDRTVQALLIAYLIFLPFHNVWELPVFGHKLQPPELIFILLFLVAVPYIFRNRQRLWFSPIDVGILGWLAVNVFSGLHAGLSVPIFIELFGTLYLTILYFTIRLTIGERLLKKFSRISNYYRRDCGLAWNNRGVPCDGRN